MPGIAGTLIIANRTFELLASVPPKTTFFSPKSWASTKLLLGTLVAGTPFLYFFVNTLWLGVVRSENWMILCWLHHCTEDLSEKMCSPVGMFCPRRLSHSYLAIPHACTRQTGRYARHRRKNVNRPDMSGQQVRSKASWVNLTHRRSLFLLCVCVCTLPSNWNSSWSQNNTTFCSWFSWFAMSFCCCCICENSLAVHWISLCVCVHVSPFFLSVWGLDLFHFHSSCHVGLNVSDRCSFS